MASAAGGMEIEDVAARTPDLILKEAFDPGIGLQPFQARKLAFGIGVPAASVNAAAAAMGALAKAYVAKDCSLAEINPFIPVSYTHLDVYKRQHTPRSPLTSIAAPQHEISVHNAAK